MSTLTEQFNELALLMEEGLPLEQELERQVGKLISNYDTAERAGEFANKEMVPYPGHGGTILSSWLAGKKIYEPFEKWFDANFRVNLTNTPRGGKPVKQAWGKFVYRIKPGMLDKSKISAMDGAWKEFKPVVPKLVKLFTDEGKQVTREIKTRSALYINQKGLASATFKKYVKALDVILGGLKGWRRKALGNGLKVALAGRDTFGGSSANGRYNQRNDTLFVKVTPAVMKRASGAYGAPDYVLIHELGHRYDTQHHIGDRFEKPEWMTTRYSQADSLAGSEAFAELFALGHFGITKVRSDEFAGVLDRFEQEMK